MQDRDHAAAGPGRRSRVTAAPGLLLHFAPGARPDASGIAAVCGDAALTHHPLDQADPAELTVAGLPFAVIGLSPGPGARAPAPRHAYDTVPAALARGEVVRIASAEQASTATALPVLRVLAGLGCAVAGLAGLTAIGWEPAATVMSPAYFERVIGAWLGGGAFPGLGLAGLVRDGDRLRSEGLALFTGHEIAVTLAAGGSPAGAARLAVRAMHALVEEQCGTDALPVRLGNPRLPIACCADGGLLTIG